jgi:hypothetical protein
MKKGLLLAAALLIPLLAGCSDEYFGPTESIHVRLTAVYWSWGQPSQSYTLDYRLQPGQWFGPSVFADRPLFKLDRVYPDWRAKVRFDDSLYIIDDPDSDRSTIVLSLDEVCFRTRSYDVGADYCLRVMKPSRHR